MSDGIEFDFRGLVESLVNQSLNNFVVAAQQNDKDARAMRRMLEGFNRRGVSSKVVMEVLAEWCREAEV